jgi:nucleotide-binding universal stress UspA family protein
MNPALDTIVAATDLRARGNDAVRRAAQIAAANGMGSIRAVHATGMRPLDGILRRSRADHASRKLGDLAVDIRRENDLLVVPRLRAGRVARVLADEAMRAGLVVVGASGDHPIRDVLAGSTAERLLGRGRASILVVRTPPREAYRRVLVALDLSRFDETVLARARAIAPGADLRVMHVFDTGFEGKMRYAGAGWDAIQHYRSTSRELALREMLASPHGHPEYGPAILVPGPVASNVVAQARSAKADLIVVGHPKRPWLENLLVPRIAPRVIAGARTDVLAVC